MALEEPEIGSTDPNIPIENNCIEYELHFGMPGGSDDYDNESDEIEESDAIPTASQRRRATAALARLDLGTNDAGRYEDNDSNGSAQPASGPGSDR